MSYVFDKALFRAQQSRRTRQAKIREAADECPEPVGERLHPTSGRTCDGNEGSSRRCLGVGIRSSTRGSSQCEFVSKLRNAVIQSHLVEAPLERQRHLGTFPTPLSTSGVSDALSHRDSSHICAIKEAMAAEAESSGLLKARPADYVGINYQDDPDLMEMLGYTDELTCPSNPEGVFPETTILLEHLPRPRLPDKVLHHMTGLIRGAKQKFESRIGKISELIDVG